MKKLARPLVTSVILFALAAGYVVDGPAFSHGHEYSLAEDPAAPLEPVCDRQGIIWPPQRVQLIAFKEEKVMEVWAANEAGPFRRLTTYSILAASGKLGPKQREGDMQVPEGLYRLTDLNPNSKYHFSIRVDYPNAADIANSPLPKGQMGGDIMVHGNSVSAGCIAIGDEAIERVYALVEFAPRTNRWILIAPVDLRLKPMFRIDGEDARVDSLYAELAASLHRFPIDGNKASDNGSK